MMELTNIKAKADHAKQETKEKKDPAEVAEERAAPPPVQSVQTDTASLSLKTIVCSYKLWFVFITLLLLFACSVFLFVYYKFILFAQWDRTMIFFAFVVGFACLFQIVLCWKELRKGFQGKITKKPFSRPANPKLSFEFGINGKYYLYRVYITETLELIYQLFNYSTYACSMSAKLLIPYSVAIATECCVRVWNRKNTNLPIANKEKSLEMLLDLLVDFFALVYPPLAIFFETELPFRDIDLVQLLAFPVLCLFLKIRLIFYEEVVQIVYKDFTRLEGLRRGVSDMRMHRRSSFGLRENGVIEAQNRHCSKRAKQGVLALAMVWSVFFIALSSFQILNALVRTSSEHYTFYCKVNAPACNNWFVLEENCLHVRYMSTNEPHDTDEMMRKFSTSTATQIIEMSFTNDTTIFKGKFPKLRRLLLYKPVATTMIPLEGWPNLVFFAVFHAANLKKIAGCCGPSLPATVLTFENSPKLVLDRLDMPDLKYLFASEITLPAKISIPKVKTLHLRHMNLLQLPPSLEKRSYEELNLAGNNISSLNAHANHIIDIRYNSISTYDEKRANYNYAYKNKVCLKGFDCTPFCHPKCKNKYYYPDRMKTLCNIQCVEYCPMSNACSKIFSK